MRWLLSLLLFRRRPAQREPGKLSAATKSKLLAHGMARAHRKGALR